MQNNPMLSVKTQHRCSKRYAVLLSILLTFPLASFAQGIGIIYNPESSYQSRFLSALSTALFVDKTLTISTIDRAQLTTDTLNKSAIDTLVNLDSDSINTLISLNHPTPTIHAMTTLANARHYAPCLPLCINSLEQHRFFVLDQPLIRNLDLIQLISPSFKDIAVIVTHYSAPHLNDVASLSKKRQQTVSKYLTDSTSLRFEIDGISKQSDIILAVADTDIYNVSSLSQILLTSYRHKTPVIGFSKGFIKAGAIAGTVSNLRQLVQQLSENLLSTAEYQKGKVIYPKYFDVISNRNVAKSLNLHFPSDDTLKQQLSVHEGLQ